ncbi:MAG: cation-translocating P-type ATPase [Desulfurococcus sp.]|nr:cation-translocating P-type ATPase [Desulfurococcus sp.]
MSLAEDVKWHSLELSEVFEKLKTEPKGLSSEEAARRLGEYGFNEIVVEEKVSPWMLLLGQFKSPLIILLLFATGLSMVIGELIDAIVIIAIVIASAVLGFYQEYRAERALEALKKMTAPVARVLRDGKITVVKAREVVPGDILLLEAGDRVAADARLIESVSLKVDESSLTGESYSVEKIVGKLPPETPLADRVNMVFAGTVVTYGKGKAVVVATGARTELGKIAEEIRGAEEKKTPLELRMEQIGKLLAVLSLSVAAIVASIGVFVWGYDPFDMVFWAISLAVAAVPEALPAVVTSTLAIGMYRMAKRNAIVTRLPAVETLGSATYICSDKTGTMTKGEMTARKIYVSGRILEVTGSGYEPSGEILDGERRVDIAGFKELELLLLAGVLNNDARIVVENNRRMIIGDTTEGALLVLAEKAGLDVERIREAYPRVGEVPFSSERKRMSTYHKMPSGEYYIFVKGAPEIILGFSKYVMRNGVIEELTESSKAEIARVNEELASQGYRNLAIAFRRVSAEEASSPSEAHENNLVFLGLVGLMDPPRPEVKEAIKECKKAGISVAMITGDHKLTAVAIARELGLYNEGDEVLTGAELESMSFEELVEKAENIRVYARVSPEHKLKIVKALKKKGHVVAMTGDGVNDAPALKAADIGVAMGITGTEVAKEAADMILADDNFATIVAAVREGRVIFENIRKYLAYLLSCNIAEIVVPLLAAFLKLPLPFYAIHYLWINLVTDGLPALALGVDPAEPDIMERPPRRLDSPVFSKREVFMYLVFLPLLLSVLLTTSFHFSLNVMGENEAEARATVFTSIIVTELLIALSARSLRHPAVKVGIFKNKYLTLSVVASLILQLIILYTPQLASLFKIAPPILSDWLIASTVALITFASIEILKYVYE